MKLKDFLQLVGFLFVQPVHMGSVFSTPELALLVFVGIIGDIILANLAVKLIKK